MAEDEGRPAEDQDGEDQDAPEDEREAETEDGKDEESDPVKLKADRDKAIRRRDRALAERRALKEELDKLKSKDKGEDEPDPVAEANTRLVRAEAKGVLAAAGVTDRDDQAAVLEVLNLADVEVDSRGDVDTDAIEERVSRLREIFGGLAAAKNGRRPRVDVRDKGRGGSTSADPDSDRYKRILKGIRA